MTRFARWWPLAVVLLWASAAAPAEQGEKKLNPKAAPPAVREAFGEQLPRARVPGVPEEKAPGGWLHEVDSGRRGRRFDVTRRSGGGLVFVEGTNPMVGSSCGGGCAEKEIPLSGNHPRRTDQQRRRPEL